MSRPWTRSLTPSAEQEAGVSNPSEAGQEVLERPSHKHIGGEGLQLDGLDAQEKIGHAALELFLKDSLEI